MAIRLSFFETCTLSRYLLGFYTLSACSASCPAGVMWWLSKPKISCHWSSQVLSLGCICVLALHPLSPESADTGMQFGFSHLAFLLPLACCCPSSCQLLALSSFECQFSPWVTSAWLQRSPADFHLLDHLLLTPLYYCPYFPSVLAFLIAYSSSSH